ncbi:hypothetical protein ACRAVF_19175 [Bradyrhizobium oligotrophicum S58]
MLQPGQRDIVLREFPKMPLQIPLRVAPAEVVSYHEMRYVVDNIVWAKTSTDLEQYEFLRPYDWTTQDVLRHLLSPSPKP